MNTVCYNTLKCYASLSECGHVQYFLYNMYQFVLVSSYCVRTYFDPRNSHRYATVCITALFDTTEYYIDTIISIEYCIKYI